MNRFPGSRLPSADVIGSDYNTITRSKTKKTTVTEVTTTRTVEVTKSVTKTNLPRCCTDTASVATPTTTIASSSPPSSPSFSPSSSPSFSPPSTPAPSSTASLPLSPRAASPLIPAPRLNEHVVHIPHPSQIQPPADGTQPSGFWLITVGQEVGIFYDWAEVQLRTSKISGATQYRCSSFQDAMIRYTSHYNRGLLRANPVPNGPFWRTTQTRSPAMSTTSINSHSSDELWSQVDDISLDFTNLLIDDE
ncbi:hypothetical protein BJ138DRAFT_1119232 [Hygrophoropsis aurantiaca]|uniref:Uncharacterized protein n=1 Tax=Hygrophoropsis aurantiaca TaxID=72124 RepID=A0ACB7ZUU3_9AGAM|nr:hypothetical protein BJ138DRAFT_1119232 [Hygrophoropsis aurantiaca]